MIFGRNNTQKDSKKNKKRGFDLRFKLILFVTIELIFIVLIAYGIDALIKSVTQNLILPDDRQIPFIVDLVIISLLVGVFATYGLSVWILKPIRRFGGAISKITEGDFSVRVSTKSSSSEIQDIYSGFNLMAEELEATEILKTDFISNVSHEFKTPINAIEGYSMLLQDNENLTEEQREYVEKILYNTQRLSSLTGSILLLSKIENQTITTDKSEFQLDEQIRETIVSLEPSWEKKNVDFDVEMDDISYYGSEKLMHHVWSNLIGNAVKFGPDGGIVRIRLWSDEKNIFFTVEDNGPGLSSEDAKRIFDKFYQADSSHRSEGNGLGLALVKRILTLEGGDISAKNGDSGGACFTVNLERKSAPFDEDNAEN